MTPARLVVSSEGAGAKPRQAAHRQLTDAPVPGVVAAAALEVAHAAVPGQGVHDAGGADGVHEGRLPGSWGRGEKKPSHVNVRTGPGLLGRELYC